MALPKTLKTVVIVILVEIVVLAAGCLIVMYAGLYNVAATKPHLSITHWVFTTTMDKSVRHHASSIPVSDVYKTPDLAEGCEHYREMCGGCHGAPGVERSEIGAGMNPPPEDLAEAAEDWTPSEVFWIIKNGVKMTGMPGFGPTHDDKKLWNITAFVKRLPGMTAQQYQDFGKTPETGAHP